MAVYHCAVKTVSRSTGRSSVAAAAYRCGQRLEDQRTGRAHDYRAKAGVTHEEVILPEGAPEWMRNREALWNAAEAAEVRKDAKTAREYELALPAELTPEQNKALVHEFGKWIAQRHGVAVDASIHAPHVRDPVNDLPGGDARNWHAHVLTSTREVTAQGFGEKTRALDVKATSAALIEEIRGQWAEMTNRHLAEAGHQVRVDHRSYERQGVETTPTAHIGSESLSLARHGVELDRVQAWRETREAQVIDLQTEREGRKEPPPAPNTRAQDLEWLAAVVSELEIAQAEAAKDRKPIWVGPDGVERPLHMQWRLPGGPPMRGPVRFTERDARDHIQRDWRTTNASYAAAHEALRDLQKEIRETAFWKKLFSPTLRQELAAAEARVIKLGRRVQALDRAWKSPKAQKWAADLLAKGEKARSKAETRVQRADSRHDAVTKSLDRQRGLLKALETLDGWKPSEGAALERADRLRQLEEARRKAEEQRQRELERVLREQGEEERRRPAFRRPRR